MDRHPARSTDIFGNRDFGFERARDERAGAADERRGARALDEMLARSVPPSAPAHHRRVLIRVQGGEEIVVGEAHDRDEAVQMARDLVREVEEAAARSEWPEIDGRFVRPGAIVSIDVQRAE